MAKIIAVTNQKGGVGKTTTSINLSACLAQTGCRVLLVDLDPQGNATMGAGIDKQTVKNTCFDVLVENAAIEQVTYYSDNAKLDVLASNLDLAGAEVYLLDTDQREHKLKLAIDRVRTNYDYIIIDCPPSLNMLTINALVAANSVIVPMQCEYFALEGLSSLMETLKQIQQSVNPELRLEGLLRTMFDNRSNLTQEVNEQLMTHFGDRIFETVIPRNIRLAEAPSFGLPAIYYDKASRGAKAYTALASELQNKHR